jgi:PhzF family phenazine biosynthesis protein
VSLPLFIADAFTSEVFRGNPAAIVFLDGPRPDAWLQKVAIEMNLSETAFVRPQDDGYSLRWFTPGVEVPLCGHATLATAHVLWETGRLPRDAEARFHTKSGLLTARSRGGSRIEMDFPSLPVEQSPLFGDAQKALGVTPYISARTPEAKEMNFLLELDSEPQVRDLRPDFPALRKIFWGFIVTARSDDPRFDFVSRYFAAGQGIDEDPVTGSAHCSLAPYWADRLKKTDLVGHQISARGGVVHCALRGDRVALGGDAVTVARGELVA